MESLRRLLSIAHWLSASNLVDSRCAARADEQYSHLAGFRGPLRISSRAACCAAASLRGALLLHPVDAQDAGLVEQDGGQRHGDHAEGIGRREHAGRRRDGDDGVAAEAAQALRA